MEMSILSQCSGRGLVYFFAMAALLNVALCVFSNFYCDHFSALSHPHFESFVCFSYIEW